MRWQAEKHQAVQECSITPAQHPLSLPKKESLDLPSGNTAPLLWGESAPLAWGLVNAHMATSGHSEWVSNGRVA